MATSPDEKKIADITKSDKVPAEATSRPIIVGNRSMVKDSTLKHDEQPDPEVSTGAEQDQSAKQVKSEAKTIIPVSAGLEASAKPDAKKEEEPVQEEATKPETPKAPEENEKPEADNDQVELGRADQKKEVELTEAEKAQKEKMDKLIASGKYVVPVGHIKRNRKVRKLLSIVILLLLIGVVAGDLLLDAGVIKTTIVKAPTNFFKNY